LPQVVFTANLQRHLLCPVKQVSGNSVIAALEAVFADIPKLRSYILDDQGQLRKHVVIFIDGQMIIDRAGLSDTVEAASEIYVMQALSGG
jgi:molybdopterin converting factor small subunit